MRLDPFGLTGPPTSKRREKKQQRSYSSSASSSASSSGSLLECVPFVSAAAVASSRSFPGSIRDRVVDDDCVFARHHDGLDNEEAGTATAFRVPSRDFVSRGVRISVRARTRDCHEDHEDENDDYDVDVLCVDCRPSPQRRRWAPRSAPRARGRIRTRRERGSEIPEERPDVAASIASFVDVLANTAYRDDDDDDDDDGDGDDEGQARCKRKRIHGGREEHTKNESDDDDNARVSVPSNKQEDYIRAKVDAIKIRGVPKNDHQWASSSLSLDERKNRRCEHPTVDEEFDGQGRRKGNEWRRSDNTAWFQKPITRRRGEKPRTRRSYYRLLLFMLYLLAWPLLCSTSPSAHYTSTFTQNSTLAHTKNSAQRGNPNHSSLDASYSSSQHQHQHQQSRQYIQGSDYSTDYERHHHHQQLQPQQQQQQQQSQERKEKRESRRDRREEPVSPRPWDVNHLNPWLSACDLAGPAPADLQGSCSQGATEVPKYCPMQCRDADKVLNEIVKTGTTTTTMKKVEDEKREKKKKGEPNAQEQCLLYLQVSHKEKVCGSDDFGLSMEKSPEGRKNLRSRIVSNLRLRHCCEQAVVNALAPHGSLENVLNGGPKCVEALNELLIADALAARLNCEFEEVLARYDCAQPYSVIHNCTHCKRHINDASFATIPRLHSVLEAYRRWVCSSLVPYFANKKGPTDTINREGRWTGVRLRPCRSFCQSVEQRCPYLLPGDRAPAYPTQYAGEPTFLCRDPKIPETGEQAARALHNTDDNECCFHMCTEDEPISGICPNCENPLKHGRPYDPSTAPQCDTSGPTGQQSPGSQTGQPEAATTRGPADDDQETSTALSSSSTPASSSTTIGKKDTLFCGSGRIGSITSASSPGRSSPSIVFQLLWLCSILISLPANALQYNLASTWSPLGVFRLIGPGLPRAFVLRRTFNGLGASAFGSRSAGIYLRAVRCLLFILWMPRRAVTKCRRRGWWWWRTWRRSSSRHFRWKCSRRVASWRSVLRDASTAVLVLFLKFATKCRRCRDWWCFWWLWRRWRKKVRGSTDGQNAGLVVRRKRSTTTAHGTRRRGRRRGRGPSGILETDVAGWAKATSRKDPP